jgi:hypothetical protein
MRRNVNPDQNPAVTPRRGNSAPTSKTFYRSGHVLNVAAHRKKTSPDYGAGIAAATNVPGYGQVVSMM